MVTDEMGLVQVSFRVVFLHHPSSVATLDTGWLEILLNHQQRMMCGILVILLMEEILHQLIPSRQFIPLSIRIMYIPGGAGFLPSIVSGCVIHRNFPKMASGFFVYLHHPKLGRKMMCRFSCPTLFWGKLYILQATSAGYQSLLGMKELAVIWETSLDVAFKLFVHFYRRTFRKVIQF